jgi:hypothetical protein
MFYADDFGSKDNEHRIYKTYLETIYNEPNLLTSRDSESRRKSAEKALKNFKVRIFYLNHGECV